MKKILLSLAALGLAVGSAPAFANGDPGTNPPPETDWYQEFVYNMCVLTGADFYCSRVDPNYKPPTPQP